MKILILTNYSLGFYKFRKELVEELVKKNTVYICVPKGDFVPELEQLGTTVIDCPMLERRGTNPMQDMKLKDYYRDLIRKIHPDTVLTYTIKPNVYGGMVCAEEHIPYIANITGLGTAIENGGPIAAVALQLYRKGLRKAQKVFFQSSSNCDFMLKHNVLNGPFEVLPGSGVNTADNSYAAYPLSDDKVIFTTIGRIMKDKGIEELLEAAAQVKKYKKNVEFRLIGNYDEDYTIQIGEAEKNGILVHYEEQKSIKQFIADSHAIIHASYHEGMSNVLQEAASAGRPVIATNIPGCEEIFEDGVTGIGFEPRNPLDLTRAIWQFLSLSRDEKEKMGEAGRAKMQVEFERRIVVEKYMQELGESPKI